MSESTNISFGLSSVYRTNTADGLKVFKYNNGMKRFKGLIEVTATVTANENALFSIPSDYAQTTNEGTMQVWIPVMLVGYADAKQAIFRLSGSRGWLWASQLTLGTWACNTLYA